MEMTRVEVFVDAAFAFAVTMLVISFDAIPGNWDEMLLAVKTIPAFAVAVAQLVWIWHEHSVWSKRFGLDDGITVLLSTVLLILVLIYIYPLRIMAAGFPFYAYGMVLTAAFNGAGDAWTPTWLNLGCFWLWEIPLAWALSFPGEMGPSGVFVAIAVAFSTLAVAAGVFFRRGRWREATV